MSIRNKIIGLATSLVGLGVAYPEYATVYSEPEVKDNKVYHGTSVESGVSILTDGVIRPVGGLWERGEEAGSVSLTTDEETGMIYGRAGVVFVFNWDVLKEQNLGLLPMLGVDFDEIVEREGLPTDWNHADIISLYPYVYWNTSDYAPSTEIRSYSPVFIGGAVEYLLVNPTRLIDVGDLDRISERGYALYLEDKGYKFYRGWLMMSAEEFLSEFA